LLVQGQERDARSQRIPASLRVGRAFPGADALLFRHTFPSRLGLMHRFEKQKSGLFIDVLNKTIAIGCWC